MVVVMLVEIQRWLLQPKVWRFVCLVSSVVGLLCYALSSPFNDLFGKWSWWKILLYIVFSFNICLAVLFAKARDGSTNFRLEAHTAFLVLVISSVYSFFVDKVVKGRPDAYSLVSCAAFAIMSLGLSRLTHFGFEIDLLYFFSGLLIVQFMKIKFWLVIVGGSFSYSLIILRSTVDALLLRGDLELQAIDEDVESGSLSLGTNGNASHVDSHQAIITGTGDTNSQADVPLENEDLGFLVSQVRSHSQQGSNDSDNDNRQIDPLLSSFNREDRSWRTEKMEKEWKQLREQRVYSLIELLSSGRSVDRNAMFGGAARLESVINSCTVIEKERIGKILIAQFMDRIEALKKKNESVVGTISKHVDEYLQAEVVVDKDQISVPPIHPDDNLVVDALRFDDDVRRLRETARLMVMAGFEGECHRAYCGWRREFLKESFSTFGLQVHELNMEDTDKMEKNVCWIKALNIAVRILFPNERRLCDSVFGGFSISDFAFTEVCTESATHLLRTANILAKLIPNTLEELMYEFELLFSAEYSKSLRKDARRVRKGLGIVMELENPLLTNGDEWLHPITGELVNYILDGSINRNGGLKPYVQVSRITRLFERTLKANSKNYSNPTLGYVFIMNNRSYIDREAKLHGLEAIAYDWLHKNKRKIEKNLQLYQRSSWTKILNFLKLEINESDPNTVAELMKAKLRSFNEHFGDICNDQSMWVIFDMQLRGKIIRSIENILLPAYGNFIGRMQDVLGNHAYQYIKYGMIDISNQLNNFDYKQFNPLPPSDLSSRKDKNWITEKIEREQTQLLEQHISSLIELLSSQLDEDHIPVPQIERDDNLVLDALRSDDNDNIVGDLGEAAKLMLAEGISERVSLHSWIESEELNMEESDKTEKIQIWIKALNVAVRILFPNELGLWKDFALTEVCTEFAVRLLSTLQIHWLNSSQHIGRTRV
ncbi:Exocyst complex component EXO70B1, partial [Mucuna pruriens]